MTFDIYKIQSPLLARYVQYVLFNYSDGLAAPQVITSFANTNICLGIVKEQRLICRADGVKCMQPTRGINSYLSAMYLAPHKFEVRSATDEICIDFTPLGYYHFFRFPVKTYVLNEDVLTEGFGNGAVSFFENVFEHGDFQQRGAMIERFLLSKFATADNSFLANCVYHIHRTGGEITLKRLSAALQCSEKKIVRSFTAYFDLTPKDYMRIVRFRRALANLNSGCAASLTHLGYESSYYDQSHFIKDFRFFTEKTPKQVRDSIVDVKQKVIIGVKPLTA